MSDLVERLRDQSRGGGGDAFEAANEIEKLRAALREALPEIEESYRFHRDMQSNPARILASDAVLGTVRAALGEPKP